MMGTPEANRLYWQKNGKRIRATRKPYVRTPESATRQYMRRLARREAAAKGENVQQIYTRWGCLTLKEMRELASVTEAAE